jgi:hypothetical protein
VSVQGSYAHALIQLYLCEVTSRDTGICLHYCGFFLIIVINIHTHLHSSALLREINYFLCASNFFIDAVLQLAAKNLSYLNTIINLKKNSNSFWEGAASSILNTLNWTTHISEHSLKIIVDIP